MEVEGGEVAVTEWGDRWEVPGGGGLTVRSPSFKHVTDAVDCASGDAQSTASVRW